MKMFLDQAGLLLLRWNKTQVLDSSEHKLQQYSGFSVSSDFPPIIDQKTFTPLSFHGSEIHTKNSISISA